VHNNKNVENFLTLKYIMRKKLRCESLFFF